MSWYSKVVWSEGLFLRPHHLQQNDRYVEHLLESRVRHVTPYPWGFSHIEIDRDLAQQSKFAVLKHFHGSSYVHPERLYEELLRLVGELATFATPERRAREYPAYDHDDLENVFTPVLRDIQDFLSAQLGRRAIRLQIIERAQNAFVSPIRDRALF